MIPSLFSIESILNIKCLIFNFSFMFIPKRKASAYFKVADINIFLTNLYCKGIWIKRFSQSLPNFSFIIWDSYWYLYLTREQCFININTTSSHFSKLTLPLSIIAEKMLQLAELSTKNLTDHWTGLKCGSRIAGSKVCVLRTYRSARHTHLCIIKLHIFSYCTWRIFLYLGYLQFRIGLGFVCLPPLWDSPKDSPFSSWIFCCSFQHASLWGLFSPLFYLCLILCLPLAQYTCSKLMAILLQCSPWNSR